jgi:protein-S-isoprenylcysteine O-methyltransferase Ste14
MNLMEDPMNRSGNLAIIYTTLMLGAGSLALFFAFLFIGSFTLVDLGLGHIEALVFDACLSLIFFFQHSIIIRKSIRARIVKFFPSEYYGAFYSISSSMALLILTLFWQKTYLIAAAGTAGYWLLRILFCLSIAGFYWGVKSLGSFDPFGTVNIKLIMRRREQKTVPLVAKGPYLWVRHPLYLFSLVMIWSCPYLHADKLLFNIMWTLWIIIATKLEERDLVNNFGEPYREYKKRVPMLIPWRLPRKAA